MATPQEIKKWRASFGNFVRNDKSLFSDAGKQTLAELLKDGRAIGAVDDAYEQNIQTYRTERLKYLRSQPLVSPQTGQPVFKQNVRGQVVPQTGADLFAGGNFAPQAGSENVAQARRQTMADLQSQTASEVARLKGVTDVLAPPMSDIGGNMRQFGAAVQGVMGGIGEGAKATNLLGIGSLSKALGRGPMSAAELQSGLQQTSINELTPQNALEDLSKPGRFGGFRFGQGVGGTIGGMVGSEVGAAAMTASGIGKTAAAPFVLPLAAAAASFGGGAVANYLSEGAMKGTYGEQGYKDVLRALQAAEQENPGIGMAADFGNVLLQGNPVLASGTGARQTLGMIGKSVLGNAPSYIRGTASQLGANAPKIANAIEAGIALPQAAASVTKYDTLVSNFLRKTGAASGEAIDRYATFSPTGGLGSRIKQFGQFSRDTPGVNEFLADAIGEQAVNFGQAGADYYKELREAQETGAPPPSATKALANLAFGSLFIGNNKITDNFGGKVRGIGSLGLDIAGKVPGVNRGVEALRNRYDQNLAFQNLQGRRADVLRGITSEAPTDTELAEGTRSRIGVAPGATPAAAVVAPEERPISLGAGRVALWNSTSQTARIVPFASVYGGIDDAANVEDGKAIGAGISTLETVNPNRGINRFIPGQGEQVLPTEGPSKQQVVGATDTGHVMVREVPVSAEGGRTQAPVYDIVRVEDLEEKNKARGLAILETAGIPANTEMYEATATGPMGGTAFDQITGFQRGVEAIGTSVTTTINKEFPTVVQFGQNQELRGRVVGVEKNGDIQFQLMTPGMSIVRVDPGNVLGGSTSIMEPMAIADILSESDLSDKARPEPSKRHDVFDGSQTKFHTILGNNVHLTAEQQAKIGPAVAAIAAAKRDAATRSTDSRVINQAVTNETNKQLKDIFGGRVQPVDARNDYEIGTPIIVNGPNGREVGLVIDNADAGPVVHLDSMDGDPVVIQESDVVSGTPIARPEPESRATTTEATATPVPARTERDIYTENIFEDSSAFGNKRDKAMFIARQLLKRKEDEDGGFPVEAALLRVFGFTKNANGNVYATDVQLQSRFNRLYNALVTEYNRPLTSRGATTAAEKTEILDALNYLDGQLTEAMDAPNRLKTRAPRAATATTTTTPAAPATTTPAPARAAAARPATRRAAAPAPVAAVEGLDATTPTPAPTPAAVETPAAVSPLGLTSAEQAVYDEVKQLLEPQPVEGRPPFVNYGAALLKASGKGSDDKGVWSDQSVAYKKAIAELFKEADAELIQPEVGDPVEDRSKFAMGVVNPAPDGSYPNTVGRVFMPGLVFPEYLAGEQTSSTFKPNIMWGAPESGRVPEPFTDVAVETPTPLDLTPNNPIVAAAELGVTPPTPDADENIVNSAAASEDIALTSLQARTLAGLVPSVNGRSVYGTRQVNKQPKRYNIAQEIVRKSVKGLSLTRAEKALKEDLEFPDYEGNEAWYRNAYQGIQFLNDTKVRGIVSSIIKWMDESPANTLTKAINALSDDVKKTLSDAMFIGPDGKFDARSLVVHGRSERGIMFGALAQSAANTETANTTDLPGQMVSGQSGQIQEDFHGIANLEFGTFRATNKASFTSSLIGLMKKTNRGKTESKEVTEAQAQAIADMFDTFVHGATSRRIDLMMEGIEKGYFSIRSNAGDVRTLSGTRRNSGMSSVEFTASVEEDLRPVYKRLVEILGLGRNVDVRAFINRPTNAIAVANAYAQLAEEETTRFYSERIPAFANFNVLPDIQGINGALLNIYDPDQQTAMSVIMAFASADVSTFVHEIAHAYLEALPLPMQKDISSAFERRLRAPTLTHPSVLSYEAQEQFAYGLEMTLANKPESTWRGTNLSQDRVGPTQVLGKVLKAVSNAVEATYVALTNSAVVNVRDGVRYRNWEVPYVGSPNDNPNGRVYLWMNAPVIFHDGTYGIVKENFGTTKNGQRLVSVEQNGVTLDVPNAEIRAIGAPTNGLSPAVMQIMSVWIGYSVEGKKGKVASTPEARAESIVWDGDRVVSISRSGPVTSGDINSGNIANILTALGITDISDVQYRTIRERISRERLRDLNNRLPDINRKFSNGVAPLTQEDNDLRALASAYAEARLIARLKDIASPNRGNASQQSRANAALNGAADSTRSAGGRKFWAAVSAIERQIHANRTVLGSVASDLAAITKNSRTNWAIKRDGNTFAYNKQTGDITIIKKERRGGTTRESEYQVNVKTGVVQRPSTATPIVVENTMYYHDPQFRTVMKGGLISTINSEVDAALKAVGLDGAYTMRVAEPEFHIARALINAVMPDSIPTSPSVVFQSSGIRSTDDTATPMAQLSRDQQKAFVTPSIAVAPVPTGNALVTMQEAEAIGRADQAMQQSSGIKVVSQSPEVRQRQAEFVQGIIDRLTTDIDKKLDAARSAYEKKNAGETPVLYAYEAYELRDVYDVERGEPMTEMEVTESGESIPKLRWDAKAMDYVPVTKTARVRTTIYSYEDLTKLKVPVKQSANLYETDRHSSSTESATKEFKRLEFGSDRPIWINIKGKEVPSKNKAKVVSTMVGNIEGRVRDVATRWTSEYNDALAGDAINPTEAWKPQDFDAEVKMRESDGITILAPSVKVRGQGYAIDTVEGNKGWNSLTTKEIKKSLSITEARKELLDLRKIDGTDNKHHAISYVIQTDANGKPSKWGYSLMVRTTDVDAKTGTFQWKIENDWGPLNTGFASSKDALKEAQIEHDKLFGLAREKQEEEVSRHIAREVIDIIDAGRKALDKWNADNNYKFTAEEANAVNILRQFRWYKGMEERLKGTYGQFTTVMADVLGATSPQTPVWQNYAATLYLMQGDKGAHSRRVKLSAQSIARNPDLLNYFPDESSQKKAMVVVKADMSRTITVLKMHSILVKALDKSFGTNPQLTVDGLREQIADRLRSVYERDGVDDTSAAEADLFMSLMERDVPAAKRQETLDQFNRYADKSLPSRMGGIIKKDTQFRSFVNEVDDWISPKGEIARFGGKTSETKKLADIPKGIKLSLSETIVPRNLVTGALYGSNSGNILMALTNEWLTVTEGMSAKARNFAMNFVGLSRGATIDVWAARLTRRHLNEVYMGVYTTRDGESRVEDVARYGAWSQLPEPERKQFFRMSPLQEQGVAGGYVTNLPKKVSSNGYFTETDAETDPVKFAPANREQVDVTNAEFIGEFGMANRVFDRTAELINGYIGEAGFMSPADLQAVVWFAEKERWVQNGWTTAAGAGGSFEQMYHEMMERAGAYERVSGTVYQPRMRMRGAAAANLSVDEQKSLFDIATWPFLRHRRDSYQEGMGDLQREELVDGTNRHPVQSVQALAVTISNDGMYTESAENANKTNMSVTYLTGAGREAKERSYTEPIPTVIVPEADADIMFKGMTNSSRTIYLPVENSSRVFAGLHNYAVGARTSFGIAGTNGTRLLGTGVVDSVAILDAADVPDDAPAKVKHQSEKYVRIQLAETQPMTDSDVYLWNNSGRSEKMDTRTNEYTWGLPLQAFDSAPSFNADADRGVSENRVYVGQIPIGAIKNANGKKEKKNILPKPAGIPAAHPANRVMVIESTASLLSAMRDATDVFMTTTRAVTSADDPYASFLDVPSKAVGKVPMGEAWKNSKPDSNMRFGAYMLLRMPVGAERLIAGSRQAADNAHRRLMTSLRDSMPDVGYMVRIDADVRDWVSDITGNVGMPYVEIVFSPEEFIRNYNPITEVDGELPANAAERSALFNAYINGDIDAIRAAEEKFADAYESWMRRVTTDPDLSAQVMLPGLTVYDLQVIPKEKILNAPSIREFAVSEVERQAANTNIGNAVREYAEAIGKTVDVEITDEFYVSPDQPRVAEPNIVIEDWSDFREYTVMAQSGRPRIAEVTVSAYAGESRMGFQNIYSAALSDIRNGSYAEAQRKFGIISEAAGIELENAFGEFATSMSADITASVIAGDAKPSVTATVAVTADRLGTVIGRAALIGRKLGQANTFVTEKANRTRYGLEKDGAIVVPSLSITVNEPIDSVGLRTLVDSAPAIFQGATQSPDKRTLTVFMVPDGNIGNADAVAWTTEARGLLSNFVQTYTTPADSYTDESLFRLSMEVAPGTGSPADALIGSAFSGMSTKKQHEVNRQLTQSAIQEIEALMGVRLKSVIFGLGGWQHYQNASTVAQANLTPKQSEIAAYMLGYSLQQTSVWSNRITPINKDSNVYAIDFIEKGSKLLADGDKVSDIWARLIEADDTSDNLDGKLFQGFQPIRTSEGNTGIRVLIHTRGDGTSGQIERLLSGPIKRAVESLDIELDVNGYSCDLVEADNDWKEQRNGETYLERLGNLLGPSAPSTIAKLDIVRQKLEQQLKSAIETRGGKQQAIATGRRRLWNLGSVELGAKGRFIEYETVRDIVSNVAPDDSLPTAEKVANTVNQAQRREIEEALSVVAGQRINLPKRVRFKRTPEHTTFQMHVGRHYENMPKNALKSDPYVKVAYEALVSELDMQYRSLNLSVDFMQPILDRDGKPAVDASGDPMYIDPYTNAQGKLDSTLAIRDVRENRHLYVYPTTEGTVGDAGDKADFEYLAKNHPLFQQSGFKTKTGQPMMWNDVLRAVHDALAHGIYGSSFNENGEENAFVAHAILTQNPWAVWALASETRMQNSWVHYGPHRVLADGSFVTTKPDGFASQKVGLSSLECLYTGCSTVDDRLRVFSQKLRTEFGGYNGTISYLSGQTDATVPNMGSQTGAVQSEMKRKLYIMRGLPGSGKSTKAKELAGSLGQIFSTDEYFMQDGKYRFDASRLPEYHRRNLDDSTMAMRRGTGVVVIDNTNIEPFHFEKYLESGRLYGYQVEFVEFDPTNYSDAKIRELASRNTHQVPESAIRSMRDKWVKIDAKKYRDAKTMAMTGTDLPTAMSFGPMLLHNADAKDATIDLKNGTVEGNITPEVIDEAGNQSTFIPDPNGTLDDINKGIYEEPDSPNLMAQTGRIGEAARRGAAAAVAAMRPAPVTSPTTSTRTQPIKNPAARAVFVLNQILKAGAAGDASPVLMQNFPMALDKPDLFLRQLRLQAQVIFNPNLGWAGRNGRTNSKSLMYGRKLAQDVWDNEVRNRASYDLAKVSGLSVSAISNEKDLEDAKLVDPLIQLMDISELGHNSDVATEADFLQHLPGQGQSERFFMLSKDVVKMRQFDDMVQHLVDIGYNPTEFKLDKDGKLIETHWTRAVKDIAHILNVISGDVRIIEEDETDEAVMRIAKLLLFSPRWTASRLMVDRAGRGVMSFVAKSVPGGSAKVEQILRMNGMSELQLKNRDPRVGALHARLLWKSWSLWLGIIAGIYAMRATNPRTMAVSIDKGGTRFKIGDYSFRMPGALMTQIEIMTSVIDGWGEWQAQKGTVSDKPLGSVVWEKVNQTLMSRASPILSTTVEAVTQRDVLGQPAFVTDEAIKVFYEEVIEPMGLKGVPSEWNKALTKRVMWWWVRDCMEMYQTQREFGVEASEALISAAATAAYSAEGGRVNYFPKALTQRIKAGQRMETQFGSPTDFFTGGKAVIPEVDIYSPDKGPQPQDIREPLFGGTGTDLNADILRRTAPPK